MGYIVTFLGSQMVFPWRFYRHFQGTEQEARRSRSHWDQPRKAVKEMEFPGSLNRWDRWHVIPHLARTKPQKKPLIHIYIYIAFWGFNATDPTFYGNQKQPLTLLGGWAPRTWILG